MMIEALTVEFLLTIAHTIETCDGEARLGYKVKDGRLMLMLDCTRAGCHPKPISVTQTEEMRG